MHPVDNKKPTPAPVKHWGEGHWGHGPRSADVAWDGQPINQNRPESPEPQDQTHAS